MASPASNPLPFLLVSLALLLCVLPSPTLSHNENDAAAVGSGVNAAVTGLSASTNTPLLAPGTTVGVDITIGGTTVSAGTAPRAGDNTTGAPTPPRRKGHHGRPGGRWRAAEAAMGATLYERRLARDFLKAHNSVRRYFNETPFAWNQTIAAITQQYMEKLRASCSMVHTNLQWGENLFWGGGKGFGGVDAVKEWAKEHNDYDPENNSCQPGKVCGHYTQIIWKRTKQIGCARVECDSGGVLMACDYDPPGNYIGESPFQDGPE